MRIIYPTDFVRTVFVRVTNSDESIFIFFVQKSAQKESPTLKIVWSDVGVSFLKIVWSDVGVCADLCTDK